ncbi:histidinol dehydrogenase [Marinilabilia sp.]|uniref:histidinol dehydrogenase n=1 Tax=Marinilabilia sp. TaxID=2021252 RepID=UPI0025BBB041|nr:histidinol dehydrogenase [Marinilabilia sp.]
MEVFKYPAREQWNTLIRRGVRNQQDVLEKVRPILVAVRKNKDKALKEFTSRFDGVEIKTFRVTEEEVRQGCLNVKSNLKGAINEAVLNIRKFHESQKQPVKKVETSSGVVCWQRNTPIEKVGLYIPGGSAPLFSTVLMLAIPAAIAGCKEVVLCSPPDKSGNIHPAILFAAHLTGVTKIYKVGGAQAIAAMAYGTESIPAVDKIFGPGNSFVTAAKQLITLDGVAIDLPAGPSEVEVMADDSANAAFVASDLLSQAEHGPDSQAILVTNSESLIDAVKKEIAQQLHLLPRAETTRKALENSRMILLKNIDEMLEYTNLYAPEHLILSIRDYETVAEKINNAGSVFLGNYTPESAGDYASGTNHTLPTYGYARAYSGVNLDSFCKKITFQEISKKGLQKLGPVIETMAAAEHLDAHKMAVSLRLSSLE